MSCDKNQYGSDASLDVELERLTVLNTVPPRAIVSLLCPLITRLPERRAKVSSSFGSCELNWNARFRHFFNNQ